MDRKYWLVAALVALNFAVSGFFYGRLPDPVPSHWSAAGEVNGWMAKPLGVFIGPLITLLTTTVIAVVPRFSSPRSAMDSMQSFYPTIIAAIAALMLLINFASLSAATGSYAATPNYSFAGLGLFLIVIGNFLGKISRNAFVGIRTPWTLADSHVWERTHRFGGPVFVSGGVLLILAWFAAGSRPALAAILAATLLTPVIYSYLAWRRTPH